MKKGYSLMTWGIVITAVNFYIGYLNIIPNFVGYALIGIGLSNIYKTTKYEPIFKVEMLAYCLTAVSFLFDFLIWFTTGIASSFTVKSAQTIIFLILEFVLFYQMLECLIIVNKLDDQFEQKLKRYTITTLIVILISGLIILSNEPFAVLLSAVVLLLIKFYVALFVQDIKSYTN